MKEERNALCGCGSGKKYKKCCWLKNEGSTPVGDVNSGELKPAFETYNSDDLLASAAGLTLMGNNHGKNIRLEMIVADILIDYNQNPDNISDEELKAVLDKQYPSNYLEDEPVNLFSDLVSFHGGDYVVFPGITDSSSFVLSTLVRMLFLQPHPDMPAAYLDKCLQATKLLLELSNKMARTLGISRYQQGKVSKGKLSFPDAQHLEKLRGAVKITDQQLAKLKGIFGISDEILAEFLIAADDETLVGRYGEDSALPAKPLFKSKDGYIIASPATLTYALVEYIREEAKRMKCIELLRKEFHEQVWTDLQLKLKALGFDYMDMKDKGLKLFPESLGAIYQFDDNKIAYIHLETSEAKMQQAKKLPDGSTVLAEVMKTKGFQGFETLEIAIVSSLGELFMMGHNGNKQGRTLLMQAGEFEVLSGLRKINAIGLYKFAEANEALGKGNPGMDSFLDRFQLYRENKESFYLSDDELGIVPVIEPGYGEGLFTESKLSKDLHSVESRLHGQPVLMEVRRKDKYAPIYMSDTRFASGDLSMLIEGFSQPLWVSPTNIPREGIEIRKMYYQVNDAIAYWIWQVQEHILGYLSTLGREPIFVDFELLDSQKWNELERNPTRETDVRDKFDISLKEGKITIGVPPELLAYLNGSENKGDQILLEAVLRGINLLLVSSGQNPINDNEIAHIIDDKAPLGFKKKFFIIDSENNLMIDERNLQGYRYVQEYDVGKVLDQIGSLLGRDAPAVGLLKTKEEKEKFLSSVNLKALLPLLRTKLAKYNSADLLNRLLILNEGLIQKREHLRIHTPTRIACFVGEKQQQEDLLKEVGKLNEATVSVRCLIEHVGAEPYQGDEIVSQTSIDELMAIMSQIVSMGTVSDLIHFGFLDMEIGMLPTGRMGSDKSVMRNIYDPFHEAKAKENVTDAIETFDRAFAGEAKFNAKPLPQSLEKAFLADFGISLSRLFELMDAMVHIGLNQGSAAAELQLSELNSAINKLTNPYDKAEFDSAMACISLIERGKVDKLPKGGGFEFIDIMPWRFNRMLSLMRRPLVISGKKGNEIVSWGPRQLVQSKIYFVDQLVSGRFRNPIGSEIAKAIGKFAQERGDALVAGVIKAIDPTGLIIDHDVFIRESAPFFHHEDIGDVDVLIIDVANRIIYSLECKSMSPSRNGKEMVEELSKLFAGDDAWVDKHLKRDAWLKTNLDKLGKEYKTDLTGFQVKSFFVTDEEMVTPHVKKGTLPMPFVTLYDIESEGIEALRKDHSHQLKK
jgi:hypothetical protein